MGSAAKFEHTKTDINFCSSLTQIIFNICDSWETELKEMCGRLWISFSHSIVFDHYLVSVMKTSGFWDVMPHNLVNRHKHFKQTCWFHLQSGGLYTEAAGFCKMLIPIHLTAWCHIPEVSSNLYSCCYENIRPYKFWLYEFVFKQSTKLLTF
jgi:hypothetical protein